MSAYSPIYITINQVYFGYEIEDLLRLVRYRRRHEDTITQGMYTDYFGIKTRVKYFTNEETHHDKVVPGFPFPDDGIHAESIEYLGTAKALEASAGDAVTIVEMGAGYAPWLVFSAHVAKVLGKRNIQLVAVEAETARHELIKTHFQDNGLPLPGTEGPITTRIIHAAISNTRGTLNFGSANLHDWGGALQTGKGDYRGIDVAPELVPSMLISDVLKELPMVDLLHIDIQGWEAKALTASIDEVCERVKYMLIGTHSRAIEGDLIELLRARGWKLMHEKPCQFHFNTDLEDISGATWQDGAQIWANPHLEADPNPPVRLSDEDQIVADYVRGLIQTHPHDPGLREVRTLQEEVKALKASTSWKVTAPLRKIKDVISK